MSPCPPLIPGQLEFGRSSYFPQPPKSPVADQASLPGSAPGVLAIGTAAQTMAVSLCYLRSCKKLAYFHAF